MPGNYCLGLDFVNTCTSYITVGWRIAGEPRSELTTYSLRIHGGATNRCGLTLSVVFAPDTLGLRFPMSQGL